MSHQYCSPFTLHELRRVARLVAHVVSNADVRICGLLLDNEHCGRLFSDVVAKCGDMRVQYQFMFALYVAAARRTALPEAFKTCFRGQVCIGSTVRAL